MTDQLQKVRARIDDPFHDVPGLTDRERESLRLFARGWAAANIAQHLGISRSATYTHLYSAAEKVGAHWHRKVKLAEIPAMAWKLVAAEVYRPPKERSST